MLYASIPATITQKCLRGCGLMAAQAQPVQTTALRTRLRMPRKAPMTRTVYRSAILAGEQWLNEHCDTAPKLKFLRLN
jgi:hypothetical protein